jgi:hypothetical protein
MAMFITVAFDDDEVAEKFLESMELGLDFATCKPGTMQVHHDNVSPDRLIRAEFVTKED